MENINVGIIGAGNISVLHTEAYMKLNNVNIIAVCDINEERAKKYAKKYNIPQVFTSYKEMLKLIELDAVSVTTWNNAHAKITIAALKAGKNVLCEKPIAMNAKEAEEMVEVAKVSGKLLMVGFVRRFEENVNYLKTAIEKGELGKVYYAKTGYIRKWGNPGGWFSDKKRSGGGPVIDLGVHVIDLIRYVTGKPKAISVSASTFNFLGSKSNIKGLSKYTSEDSSEINDVEDAATAFIKFDNGMTLTFETSWVLYTKDNHNYLEVYGDKAGVQMEPILEFYEEKDDYFIESKPVIDATLNSFNNIFDKEIAHYVDCIVNGTECRNSAEDGLEIMRILDAIYESSKVGREIVLKR